MQGVDTIDAATTLVGQVLAVREDELPAPAPGEVYVYQLEGLDVVTNAGERLGTIERSFSTGANEVLVVQDGLARDLDSDDRRRRPIDRPRRASRGHRADSGLLDG